MSRNSFIKTEEKLAMIREGGALLGEVLSLVARHVKPGVSTKELDEIAETLIRERGGRPAFLGYKPGWGYNGFPASLCVSVNDEVVHGIPTKKRILSEGDIVGLDIGMEWPYNRGGTPGGYTDTAVTVGVGAISEADTKLIERTQASLYAGIAASRGGNEINDISRAIEGSLKPFGYGIVRDLVGHGVGDEVHEDPQVPNFFNKRAPTIRLVPGMVLALEPMVNRGLSDVYGADDGWTIKTSDRSRSAHFEHTIIITNGAPEIVTVRPGELQ